MRKVATDGPHTRAGEVPARSPALPVQVRAEIYEPVCPAPDLNNVVLELQEIHILSRCLYFSFGSWC